MQSLIPVWLDPHVLMHAAAIISVAALALRDQLRLRAVLLISILLSAAYNDLKTPPGYQEMMWNAVTLAINIKVIIQILMDRTHIGLSDEENELFDAFEALTPGEFRAILKLASWQTAEEEQWITFEGKKPEALFYVLRGMIDIQKAGRCFSVKPRSFIGEIAFLHDTPASATVRLKPGARYVQWPVGALRETLQKRQPLKQAMIRLISFDMASKIAAG